MRRRTATEIPDSARLPRRAVARGGKGNQGNVATTASYWGDDELMPAQSNAVLRIAVIVSVVFHLALLSIKFGAPEVINDFFRSSSTLEVVLLNRGSEEAPTTPQVRAQVNNAGGGDSDNPDDYATSPTSYAPDAVSGDSVFEDSVAEIHARREETLRYLTQARDGLASLPPIDPSWGQDDPRRIAEEERRQQLLDDIAAIEQALREESARPRRMYIGPAAVSDVKAMYYDTIRKQIEARGTENFPQHEGRPMYGQLIMEIVVNPRGELVSTTVLEGSGNAILDRQAQAIAQNSGPFQSAPAELLRVERNVEFVFIMRFKFLNDGTVHTDQLERVSAR